jgi:hypothetical protein
VCTAALFSASCTSPSASVSASSTKRSLVEPSNVSSHVNSFESSVPKSINKFNQIMRKKAHNEVQ